MTAEQERAKVVAWLRAGGTTRDYSVASFWLRARAAWIAFCSPWAFPQQEAKRAATAIERGEHLTETGHEQ